MNKGVVRVVTCFGAAILIAVAVITAAGAAMAQGGFTCVYANDDSGSPNTVDGYRVTPTSQVCVSPFQTGGESKGLSVMSDIVASPTKSVLYASDSESADIAALHAQNLTVLYSFRPAPDGTHPRTGLIRDPMGNFYGTTQMGGAFKFGTVFKLDASGNETVLHSFSFSDGQGPVAGLLRDPAGNLYGTTYGGGSSGAGTIFELDATGKETVLHNFAGTPDGEGPAAILVRDPKANFYGTTPFGGVLDLGTVFKLDSAGKETVLYNFASLPDGANPYGGVILDSSGNLYGTTQYGGDFNFGTVFEINANGEEIVLYSFVGGGDGEYPIAGVERDASGNLYGTTYQGGAYGFGTVFRLDKNAVKNVLYSFGNIPDGESPFGGVVLDAEGNLYGTTAFGGTYLAGTVFKVDANSKETVLHSFTGGADGAHPKVGVIRDAAGNLYGTTGGGGTSGLGTAFKLMP